MIHYRVSASSNSLANRAPQPRTSVQDEAACDRISRRSLRPRKLNCCILIFFIVAGFAQNPPANPPASQPDIVRILMPEGLALRKVPAGNVPKAEAISRLNEAKKTAKDKRLQKISFLLAVLGSDYPQDRDYLLGLLNNRVTKKAICDEDAGLYLVNLYWRGHH